MQNTENINEAACAPSRAGEAGANLTDVLDTNQTCDVRGLLFGGLSVCRHHEGGGGNRCHYNYGCKHQVPNFEGKGLAATNVTEGNKQ